MAYWERHSIHMRHFINSADILPGRCTLAYKDTPPKPVTFFPLYGPEFNFRSQCKRRKGSYWGGNLGGNQACTQCQQLWSIVQPTTCESSWPVMGPDRRTSAKTSGKKFFERQFSGNVQCIRCPLRWCRSVRALEPVRDPQMRGSRLSSCPQATNNLFSSFIMATLPADKVDELEKKARTGTICTENAMQRCPQPNLDQPKAKHPHTDMHQKKRQLRSTEDNVDPLLNKPMKKARQAYMDMYDDYGSLLAPGAKETGCTEAVKEKTRKSRRRSRQRAKKSPRSIQEFVCPNTGKQSIHIDGPFWRPLPLVCSIMWGPVTTTSTD